MGWSWRGVGKASVINVLIDPHLSFLAVFKEHYHKFKRALKKVLQKLHPSFFSIFHLPFFVITTRVFLYKSKHPPFQSNHFSGYMNSGVTHHCLWHHSTLSWRHLWCCEQSLEPLVLHLALTYPSDGLLDLIQALILKLSLGMGICIQNYVMLDRSIPKGEEILQKPKITQCFHC